VFYYNDLDDPGHTGGLSRSEMLTSEESGGDEPGPLDFGIYGTNLFIMIGLTNDYQAWLSLSNTHSGTYYQILSRVGVSQPPWEFGQILQASSSLTPFSNVSIHATSTRFFRGVGGDTVASVVLDPDLNLAVEPTTNGGAAQIGKFRVSLNPAPASARTVVYRISGTASNGADYTNLTGTVSVSTSGSADIVIQPLFDTNIEFSETLTLSLVLTNGYLVDPQRQTATMQIYDPRPSQMAVAVLDSGWTKLWWTNQPWAYFTLPESVKEALRSDGTPFVVLSDRDVENGALTNANGSPKYPILISLANEVIPNEEIAPLTNYVAAGGFIFAGASAFTRNTNGTFRTNFALASQMGLNCLPSDAAWYENTYVLKTTDHTLVDALPDISIVWRMPNSADEVNWGTCAQSFNYAAPHPIWQVTNSTATELARGDYCGGSACPRSYITIKSYGAGSFIYDAAMQPILCHGGNGPGMYGYLFLRRAIEAAFQSGQRPVVKLSPWPYQYNAAYMVRHDLENYVGEVANVTGSAQYENSYGAKGDYYFCTGAITNQSNFTNIVSGLQTAVGYGATIGSHNGGLPNPNLSAVTNGCFFQVDDYNYFHWGPDEALDHMDGYTYGSNSVAISFAQIDGWLTNYQTASPRTWVAPFFNATREDCYQIQEQLGVKINGEQKISPLPHWTISTRADGKRYSFLSEPVSDWFVGNGDIAEVAQVVGPWQNHSGGSGVHTSQTLHDAVDFYYSNAFLINFYSHSLTYVTDGDRGGATALMADYVAYCADTSVHPRIWPSNAREIYNWWIKRSAAQMVASYGTNASHSVATAIISGSQDTNTAIDIVALKEGALFISQLLTNGVAASTDSYRVVNGLIKVRVGTTVTNVQAEYFAGPAARDDNYSMTQGQSLSKTAAAGVLSNDWSGTWSGLVAITNTTPTHGTLAWNNNGSFTYTPTNTFWGTECFTYEATDGTNNFGTATVTVLVAKTNSLFSDDFMRCTGTSLNPWQIAPNPDSGGWALGSGAIQGDSAPAGYAFCYVNPTWTNTNYSIEAQVQFASGSYGGGLGARLDTTSGAHYGAWLYPDTSSGPANHLALIKFSGWHTWGYNGSSFTPMAQTAVTVGGGWHPLKLVCSNDVIQVFYHGTNVISMADTNTPVYSTTGPSIDVFGGTISASNLFVTPIP
jgi:hypothetical protein